MYVIDVGNEGSVVFKSTNNSAGEEPTLSDRPLQQKIERGSLYKIHIVFARMKRFRALSIGAKSTISRISHRIWEYSFFHPNLIKFGSV